jgi:hypothetical protein
MKQNYGDPPTVKEVFASTEEKIEYLASQATYWFWKPNYTSARDYAERLAELLKDQKDPERYIEEWVAIWEARGNIEEAMRYADITITQEKLRWTSYEDADRHTDWFRDDVKSLQDALFLQANRAVRLGKREKAKKYMIEAAELAKRFGLPLDEDGEALLHQLAPDFR